MRHIGPARYSSLASALVILLGIVITGWQPFLALVSLVLSSLTPGVTLFNASGRRAAAAM